MANTPHPGDTLHDLKAVTGLLAFLFDQMSHYDFAGDMIKDDAQGFGVIMKWVNERIQQADEDAKEFIDTTRFNVLREAGLPVEAYADENLRNAWRAGFAKGSSYAEKKGGLCL